MKHFRRAGLSTLYGSGCSYGYIL